MLFISFDVLKTNFNAELSTCYCYFSWKTNYICECSLTYSKLDVRKSEAPVCTAKTCVDFKEKKIYDRLVISLNIFQVICYQFL